MELWIRSQDKEILVKVNNMSLVFNNKDETCEIINSFEDHQCWQLGTYKTKERALEVLDEIQEVLCPKILMMKPNSKITLNDGVNIVLPDNCSYERIGDTYVYEMPLD